jgi:hypothetical protein
MAVHHPSYIMQHHFLSDFDRTAHSVSTICRDPYYGLRIPSGVPSRAQPAASTDLDLPRAQQAAASKGWPYGDGDGEIPRPRLCV